MSACLEVRRSAVGLVILVGILFISATCLHAQTGLRKVRVSIPAANVTYLPFYAAKDNGYYKEEGLDVEFILMSANLASTASWKRPEGNWPRDDSDLLLYQIWNEPNLDCY